jgi:hypothetical protein
MVVDGDSFRAQFRVESPGQYCFIWRLNDSEWSEPAPDASVAMKFLPNEHYRIEARAIDDDLQIDFEPATADFTIAVDRVAEVLREISHLRDKDFTVRNDAVIRLSKQWERALPALRRRRAETTDDDERWWIDAAIQEAERAAASSTSRK